MAVITEKIMSTVLGLFFASKPKDATFARAADVPDTLAVKSSAFEHNGIIPWKYGNPRTGGKNTSPPLSVSDLPPNTKTLVFVLEDVDVPLPKPIVHMSAYNIEASKTEFEEGHFDNESTLGSSTFGAGFRGSTGYLGPGPLVNTGPHRYQFQFFALEQMPDPIKPKATVDELVAIINKHALSKGILIGTFERTDAKHYVEM